ncbi:MAG: hypothetical protein AAGF01_04535 [Cyanobacteria bacterium P01_G01_bin.38]
MKKLTPEFLRAITPLFLAGIGGVIGVVVLFIPALDDAKWSSALGLAGTAIAGGAGLAQSNDKGESSSVEKEEKLRPVETPSQN